MSKHIFSFYFFHEKKILNTLEIKKESELFHRLIVVLRYKVSDIFSIFTESYFYTCNIKEITKQKIICTIIETHEIAFNKKKITAYIPLLEKEYLSQVLYTCGQEQIDEIFFVKTDLCHIKKLEQNDFDRFKKITIAGCEQAKQYKIPTIKTEILSIEKINFTNLYFFSESSTNTIANIIPLSRNNIGFFCGPEAGLTVKEEKVLKTYSAHSINLGKNILRSRDVLSFAAIFFRSLT